MKLSMKLPDGDDLRVVRYVTDPGGHRQNYPIIKAGIPISFLSQPFTSSIATATTTPSDHLSFSLSTGFSSGPSLKFSYSPNLPSPSPSPFSVTLKSGLGSFGSPIDSPLIFRAYLPLSTSNPSMPIFSLHFKPQIGNFCLRKSAVANPFPNNQNPNLKPPLDLEPVSNGGVLKMEVPNVKTHLADSEWRTSGPNQNGGIGIQGSSTHWEELKLEPVEKATSNSIVPIKSSNKGGALFPGVSFRARTTLPITKRYAVKLRWGLNLPFSDRALMPYLKVQKIEIERAAEVEGVCDNKVSDSEFDRGICLWMKKDLETMKEENREMKQLLEDMGMGAGKGMPNSNRGKGVPLQLNKSKGTRGS